MGAIVFTILLLAMSRVINPYDEGLVLTGAMRVLDGDVPHRDFFANYGPAQFGVLAALFRAFGQSILVERLYDLALRAAIAVGVFRILCRRAGLGVALAGTALCATWMWRVGAYGYPLFPCFLLALFGTSSRVEGARRDSGRPAVAAGLCNGILFAFRYDLGLLMALTHTVGLCVATGGPSDWRHGLARRLGCHAAGFLGAALPLVTYLWVAGALGPAIDDMSMTTGVYRPMRGLPFPGWQAIRQDPEVAAVYVPILALAVVTLPLAWSWRGRWRGGAGASSIPARATANAARDPFGVMYSLLVVAMLAKGWVVVSVVHMLPAIIASIVLGLGGIDAVGVRRRRWSWAAVLLAALTACCGVWRELGADFADPSRTAAAWLANAAGLITIEPLQRPGCPPLDRLDLGMLEPEYIRMAQLLQSVSEPGERVFVGAGRHDKLFVNPMALYFLAGRRPGTAWDHFEPGIQTRADIQQRMIDQLRQADVRWLVLDSTWDEYGLPNGSALSSGVRLLDDYLRQNYRPVAGSFKLSLWVANHADAAAVAARLERSRDCR